MMLCRSTGLQRSAQAAKPSTMVRPEANDEESGTNQSYIDAETLCFIASVFTLCF